ncbi:MAG: DUF2085 domain-containing protein [Aggregatilineaceae bacterium]
MDTHHLHLAAQRSAARPFGRRTVILLVIFAALIAGLWLALTPPGLPGKADAIGYAVCHRIAARSFHAHDRPLPLCARCTGIYLGVWAGLAFFAARGRMRTSHLPRPSLLAVMLVLALGYAFDGLNSFLSSFERYTPLYGPHNTLRLLTGATFGVALITIVWPVVNSLLWRRPPPYAPVRSWRELIALYGLALGCAALVLPDIAVLRAMLGAISAGGVLFMFTLVGGVLFVGITRRENSFVRWADLLAPALAGLIVALLIVGGIDAVRYALTGTWDGFTLP